MQLTTFVEMLAAGTLLQSWGTPRPSQPQSLQLQVLSEQYFGKNPFELAGKVMLDIESKKTKKGPFLNAFPSLNLRAAPNRDVTRQCNTSITVLTFSTIATTKSESLRFKSWNVASSHSLIPTICDRVPHSAKFKVKIPAWKMETDSSVQSSLLTSWHSTLT